MVSKVLGKATLAPNMTYHLGAASIMGNTCAMQFFGIPVTMVLEPGQRLLVQYKPTGGCLEAIVVRVIE
jgi:hypothetical protein